jgi:hypothetical protein
MTDHVVWPAGSLKLLNKAYLHYLLRPGQPAPAEVLAVMQQQRSGNSSAGNAAGGAQHESAGGALFSFAKGMAHAPRHTVNAQVSSGCVGSLQRIQNVEV